MTKDKAPPADGAPAGEPAATGAQRPPEGTPTRVVWDDSAMATAFANVINVLSSREEFTLLFGTNQTWNPPGNRELTVRLSNRIVLSPFAAKRLATLLNLRIQEYEGRFGVLDLEG